MQINMSDSYFEREEGVVIGDGVYFKLDPTSYSASPKEEPKTLQVFSQILTFENTTLVLTTVRDMSYWLDLEKSKNMSKLQTVAFASAAHEFKNPLNAIVSALEILEPLIENQRGKQYYHLAKSCSNLMLFLVKDILDYSQIES